MKILVTGGAGFIGSHLVDRLISDGYDVVVTDNLFRGKLENIKQHIDSGKINFHNTDIRDYSGLLKVMQGCEVVFHLAAQSNVMGAVENIDYSFESNVVGCFNTLKAAKETGVKRFIFSSSREAYGEAQYLPVDEKHPLSSKNTYGASKVAGEKYCEVFQNMCDLEVVIFRLANVYGERDYNRVIPIFLNNAFNKKDIHIYGGKQVIDFVSIKIIIEAFMQAINNQEALSGATLFDLASRIMKLTNTDIKVAVDPPRTVEVVKFTANIERFKKIFEIHLPEDPLYYLETMIKKLRIPLKG